MQADNGKYNFKSIVMIPPGNITIRNERKGEIEGIICDQLVNDFCKWDHKGITTVLFSEMSKCKLVCGASLCGIGISAMHPTISLLKERVIKGTYFPVQSRNHETRKIKCCTSLPSHFMGL